MKIDHNVTDAYIAKFIGVRKKEVQLYLEDLGWPSDTAKETHDRLMRFFRVVFDLGGVDFDKEVCTEDSTEDWAFGDDTTYVMIDVILYGEEARFNYFGSKGTLTELGKRLITAMVVGGKALRDVAKRRTLKGQDWKDQIWSVVQDLESDVREEN